MVTDDEIERLLKLSKNTHGPNRSYYERMTSIAETPSRNARFLISNYADHFSGIINDYLRRQSNVYSHRDDYYEFYKYLLNKSLDECLSFNNNKVIRIDNPSIGSEFALEWYKNRVGQEICYPYFLSTTKFLRGKCNFCLSIETNSNSAGKDIEPYLSTGMAESEKEVLFKSGSKFKIISVSKSKGRISLKEISRHKQIGFIAIYNDTFHKDPYIEKILDERFLNDDNELSLSDKGWI